VGSIFSKIKTIITRKITTITGTRRRRHTKRARRANKNQKKRRIGDKEVKYLNELVNILKL
jgi:hypothetical protein